MAYGILVSAQVLLVLTLGLWTLGFRTRAWQFSFWKRPFVEVPQEDNNYYNGKWVSLIRQLPSLTTPRGFTQSDIRNPCERYGNGFLQIILVILFVIAHLGVKEILNWSHDSLYGLRKWSVGKSDILLAGSPPWQCLARRSSSRGSTLSPSAVPSFCSTLLGSVNYHAIIWMIAKK